MINSLKCKVLLIQIKKFHYWGRTNCLKNKAQKRKLMGILLALLHIFPVEKSLQKIFKKKDFSGFSKIF